jgi:hypothetical protein
MTQSEQRNSSHQGYVPKAGDPVTIAGVQGRFVVISVDSDKRTASIATATAPAVAAYSAAWSALSYLDESQRQH